MQVTVFHYEHRRATGKLRIDVHNNNYIDNTNALKAMCVMELYNISEVLCLSALFRSL
jgi:hypothetical protein